MSNRDSLGFGDLIPQDVVDIFAQEKHSKRGRKKRSHSLGRALGWLKGKKRKELGGKGHNLGLGHALDLALDGHPAGHQGGHKGGQRSGRHAHHQAAQKLDDDDKAPEPPLFQENVFIEASRPKYLENLHTEALEGLKLMQQEEGNNGVEYQDNESTVSTMSVQTDGEGGGFMTDSTIADTTSVVSVQSSVSTRSSRSGLTRQGSTFRPLNSGKKSEKSKTRRKHRKTGAGIPQHVQKEMGLDRVGWTTQRLDEEQLYNGDVDNSPTTDDMNIIKPLNNDQLEQLGATHAGHRDDLALLHYPGSDLSGELRPRSLAVPWMTTANSLQEPPSPVMSMSPQAAYMSKIIPNAVLPPSIDVVEINRGRSRNSVRTVSKSSLVLSSPVPSRASSRASSTRTTSSRGSTITSASRNNPPNQSDSSCWSNSESSETLVSDSSTISSSSTPRQKSLEDGDGSGKENRTSAQSSYNASNCTSNGKLIVKGDEVKKEGFVRSLSVMKPKRAPPPPSRSYSLHNKMKRRSRDLAEVRVVTGVSLQSISASGDENEKNKSGSSPMPSRAIDSPGYNADTSSLEDSVGSASHSPFRSQLQALKAEEAAKVEVSKEASPEKQEVPQSKIVSPSSGYSSQEGTSAQLSKPPPNTAPRHKVILAKLQRLFPGSTPAASTPPAALQPEAPGNTKSTVDLKSDASVVTASASPSVRTLRDLFNIPPHPKVHAPPPPPPEVWAHSKRTFELLLGPPAPDNIYAIIKKNPKDRRQQRKSPSASTEGSVKSLVVERKHRNPTVTAEAVNGSVLVETMKVQESGIVTAEIHRESSDRLVENENVDLKGKRKVTEKDEKVRVSDVLNGMLVKAVERREERLAAVREEETRDTTPQIKEVKMDTLAAISVVRIAPSPSPPPGHNPPQPPTNQTPVVSPESCWPPPPPPMGLGGTDELDFPLPPPPMFGEEVLVIPVQVPPERSTPPLNIPPPPPYSAPPPPAEAAPPPTIKKISPPPPIEVSPPQLKHVSLPPPKVVSLPPLKEVSPPPPKQISPPPPVEVSLPPPKEFSPPPPKLISLPPLIEDFALPPEEVPPPPPNQISPPPPMEVSLPPPKEFSPPPLKLISPPPPIEVLALPPEEVAPSPPKEASPPPPKKVFLPPLLEEVSLPQPQQVCPSLIQEAPPPPVQNVSTLITVVSVKEVSPLPPKDASALSTEDVSPPSSQEKDLQSSEEATPVTKLAPPQSIPPPPPLPAQPQSSEQETDPSQENVLSESETNTISFNSILTPPQSIPPQPPIEPLHPPQVESTIPDSPETQEESHSPPSEVPLSTEKPKEPVDIPVPEQGPASIKNDPSPTSTASQTPEPTSSPVVQEEPAAIVTPSLLQTVKLRSVNNSPEPPIAQEQPEVEVMLRKRQPSDQVPTPSTSAEAPQKPIRRSLIIITPSPTSPPATAASQPALPKSQSLVVAPSSISLSPTKKSPPAMATSPSMNLQEAIRLRTAAISKGGPASRLSLHSPTSPMDLNKSPSSTASFIFSKSNKKVVIDTKKNLEVSHVRMAGNEAEAAKREVIKVPPPVAKKPKSKGKEIESSEGTEQTAGQEAPQDGIKDAAEKTNGTAGTVEGGGTPSA